MGSKKTPEEGKQQDITRSKQSRRKILKSMAAGGGAVVAGKSLSDQWAKPVVDSVILPGHAQTTIGTCTITGTMTPYAPQDNQIGDPLPIPGDYTFYDVDALEWSVEPQISVTPGITDAFNLSTAFSPLSPTTISGADQNLTPDPANGTIAFEAINAAMDSLPADEMIFTTTLTPDNSALCGGPQVITIEFARYPRP